jgi:hypothetical protein
MSETNQSARWQLPLLAVNQMQKEVTHNEALATIDMLLEPIVVAAFINVPPPSPLVGQCWLIGAAPTGDWAGRAQHIACWTSGGWRWSMPRSGQTVSLENGLKARFNGSTWLLPQSVAPPTGGSAIDSEARAALNGLIAALVASGWLSAAS